MKTFIVIACVVAATAALPAHKLLLEDEAGRHYYLQPLQRHVRQAETQVGVWGPGVEAGVRHSGTIYEGDTYKLDGQGSLSKQFAPDSPLTAQGNLNFANKDTGSGLTARASHPQTGGTDLGVGGKYNLYQNGQFGVDLTGEYERHYGGARGTQDPQWNTMIQGHYDFN